MGYALGCILCGMAYQAGVVGGSGYTGAELLRLLSGHPDIDIVHVTAASNAGATVGSLYPSLGIAYPILSDPSRDAARAYGVLSRSGYASRWTFYIGADGIVKAVDQKVNTKEHGKDLTKQLEAIGVPKK